MHSLLLIYRLGPLVTSWCMRMEAKNSYLKQIARVGNNFKNISYSVASRHQRLLCGYLQSKHFFSFDEVESGPCKFYLIMYGLNVHKWYVNSVHSSMPGCWGSMLPFVIITMTNHSYNLHMSQHIWKSPTINTINCHIDVPDRCYYELSVCVICVCVCMSL